MEELIHHLHQLPDFLKNELMAHVGNTNGLEDIHIAERYLQAINHLVANKRAPLQQAHIDNIPSIFGNAPATQSDLELEARLRAIPGIAPTDFYSMTVYAQFYMESIRFLNTLKTKLESLHSHLQEQRRLHAERIAQEAARLEAARIHALAEDAARRAAEDAARARMQAEEAARRMAEEHAAQQRAREAALQLAQRQIEEAAREVAHRKAEEALRLASESVRTAEAMLGPEATKHIGVALNALKNAIEFAVVECSNALSAQGVSNAEHFEAVGKMNVFD
ncbi:hypothetical protein [Pseudomonas viridiflava]|uniref:hypothetical protein n=1 Tax=Pseudomonas viridiflava TaxID=33069 RepID=UPI000473B201|nr:hypothetical protein [Pseudomonas viridiflava]